MWLQRDVDLVYASKWHEYHVMGSLGRKQDEKAWARGLGARGDVRRGLVGRFVVCSVDSGLGVVAPHALLHRGVNVALT